MIILAHYGPYEITSSSCYSFLFSSVRTFPVFLHPFIVFIFTFLYPGCFCFSLKTPNYVIFLLKIALSYLLLKASFLRDPYLLSKPTDLCFWVVINMTKYFFLSIILVSFYQLPIEHDSSFLHCI